MNGARKQERKREATIVRYRKLYATEKEEKWKSGDTRHRHRWHRLTQTLTAPAESFPAPRFQTVRVLSAVQGAEKVVGEE